MPIEDSRASRRHAAITLAHGYWVLKDLQSRNGTSLDGKRVDQAVLRDGSAISIGATTLVFHPGETAPVPGGDIHGTVPIESLAEESGVFRIRAHQPAMDREVRVDWLHPKRGFEEAGEGLLARAIEDAAKLRGPGFLPLVEASARKEAGATFTILKGAAFTTLARNLPDFLRAALPARVHVFRTLVELVLERATWASLRFPIGLEHVEADGAGEAISIRLPALDLAAFISNANGGLPHLPQHTDYLPPECQTGPGTGAEGALPFAAAMYNLGAIGYHLLTGRKPMGDADVRKVLENHRTLRPAPANLLEPMLPEEVSRMLDRMLEKDPETRPRGRQEVLAAFAAPLPAREAAAPAAGPARVSPPRVTPARGDPGTVPAAAAARAGVAEKTPAGGTPRALAPAKPAPAAPAAVRAGARAGPTAPRESSRRPEAARVSATPSPGAREEAPAPAGLVYLPLWIIVSIVLFFAARYLTKFVLGTLDP